MLTSLPLQGATPIAIEQENGITEDLILDRSDGIALLLRGENVPYDDGYFREYWNHTVEEYTTLILTDPTDKLPVLSGIISKLRNILGDTCYAGLWKRLFASNLLWQVTSRKKQRQQRHEENRIWRIILSAWRRSDSCKVQTQWIAPSWSFASVDDEVSYTFWNWAVKHNPATCLELQDCHLIPMDANNPLGKLKAGFARVKSSLTYMTRHDGRALRRYYSNCHISLKNKQNLEAEVCFDHLSDSPWPIIEQSQGVKCNACDVLMVSPYIGLVLRATNTTRTEFMRIGIVTVCIDSVRNKILTASDYPEPRSIVLV